MFDEMLLKMKVDKDEIRGTYENTYSNISGDAGIDLFVPETITIPGKSLSYKINHLISCEATVMDRPVSFYLYPRSSMGGKTPLRMSNSVGIIDSGYRGFLMAAFYNTKKEPVTIESGDRIVQICMPDLSYDFNVQLVESLDHTERGEGGLGSTGK